ncbi:hypothetical protein CBL_20349 [Carabus blaptoides fortunei]
MEKLTPRKKKLFAELKKAKNLVTNIRRRQSIRRVLIENQALIKNVPKKKTARRNTDEERAPYISILKSSPRGYCYLKEIFHLPSTKTLNRSLGNVTLKAGQAEDFIYNVDGNEIVHLFDIPHFVKCLRNNFMTKDILFEGKRAKWSDIKQLYEYDSKTPAQKGTKLATNHTEPEKMRAKGLCAQNTSPTCSQFVSAFKTYLRVLLALNNLLFQTPLPDSRVSPTGPVPLDPSPTSSRSSGDSETGISNYNRLSHRGQGVQAENSQRKKMDKFRAFSIQKFDRNNFLLWKYQLEIDFRVEKLLDVVNGTKNKSEERAQQTARNESNAKAMLLILTSMEFDQLQTIMSCGTTALMWIRLKSIHEHRFAINKVTLKQQFFSYKMLETDTIAKHISKIESLAVRIEIPVRNFTSPMGTTRAASGEPDVYAGAEQEASEERQCVIQRQLRVKSNSARNSSFNN